jgi:hypothetical protein
VALLPESKAIFLLDKAIELRLYTLQAKALTIGEFAIEALVDRLPLLGKLNAVVPDEMHFFVFVLGPWRSPAICAFGPQSIKLGSVSLPKLLRTACQI